MRHAKLELMIRSKSKKYKNKTNQNISLYTLAVLIFFKKVVLMNLFSNGLGIRARDIFFCILKMFHFAFSKIWQQVRERSK